MDSKQAVECCGAIWPEVKELIERQEKMLVVAIEMLINLGCVLHGADCPDDVEEAGCRGCARRWLEREATK